MYHCAICYGTLTYSHRPMIYRCTKCREEYLPGSTGIWELTAECQAGLPWIPEVRCEQCYCMNPGWRTECYHCGASLAVTSSKES